MRPLVLGLLLVSLALSSVTLPEMLPKAAAQGAGTTLWKIIPSPNQGPLANALAAVAPLSATDVWAVGEYNPGVPPTVTGRYTLTMHWDGGAWQIVPSPNAPGAFMLSTLADVTAIAPDDVWAVGHVFNFNTQIGTTLIEHWNGSTWAIVASPNPGAPSTSTMLFGIAAVAADDIWAVGGYGYPVKSLTLHWDGTTWSVVPSPGSRSLVSVAAVSTSDVWAVTDGSEILHWDGNVWSVVPSPQPVAGENFFVLEAVDALSANDAWVVGTAYSFSGSASPASSTPSFPPTLKPVIEHWNGTNWTRLTNIPTGTQLFGVDAIAANQVWAVGVANSSGKALALRWNGRRWGSVATPPLTYGGALSAVRGLSISDVWAVGFSYDENSTQRTLTERYAP